MEKNALVFARVIGSELVVSGRADPFKLIANTTGYDYEKFDHLR